MRSWGVVVVSDRGDLYLPGCLENLNDVMPGVERVIVDDRDHNMGMAGAVQCGMSMALDEGWEHALWVEEDFRFNERPPIEQMRRVLDMSPSCAQIVLKRQPWSVEEHEAGGIIEMHPSDYLEVSEAGLTWLAHVRIFSMNPCLIPQHILKMGYSSGNEAEQTKRLVSQGYHFAMYGKRSDPPLVTHVGHDHVEGWRL